MEIARKGEGGAMVRLTVGVGVGVGVKCGCMLYEAACAIFRPSRGRAGCDLPALVLSAFCPPEQRHPTQLHQ